MKKEVYIGLAIGTLIALGIVANEAQAGVSGRSSFSSSRSYSAPTSYRSAPALKRVEIPAQRPVIVQRPVVVQKSVTNVTQVHNSTNTSSGGGWFSSFFGSFAGSGIANWLFAPKPQPTVDCTLEQNKALAICQPAK